MAEDERKTVGVFLRMTSYERDLIDFRARMLGMNRSRYVVQTAAYGKHEFSIDFDSFPEKELRAYNVYRYENPAVGYMPASDSKKPRKAEDNRARSEKINIRVSPYEKDTLKQYADTTGLSLTDYLLYCGLYGSELSKGKKSRFIAARDELRRLAIELRAQGRNLNQIAAAANSLRSVAWRDDVDAGLIDQLVNELLEDNRRTRAAINDALNKVLDLSDGADFRSGVVNNSCREGGDGDGDAQDALP